MFEKKRGKRFLASVMALVMLLSLAPVGALATENKDPQENPAVTLPADESNPKPVGTDGENTENTNEEPTPPPSNEGDTGTTADNNDTSTAVSEMPVIMNPVDLLNQVSDYAERKRPQSNIQDATFFYLKTPASNPYSNTVGDWGKTMGDGNGKINISNLSWTETNAPGQGHTVQNAFNVTNDTVTSWPSGSGSYDNEIGGYVLNRESKHWKTIFSAYKESIKEQLSIADVQESDVQYIILKPFKVSRYNITNGSYHVDCQVEVKGYKFATATFNLWDDEADAYKFYSAKDYKVGSPVEFPREMNKPGYTFSGWYLNEDLTGSALNEHTIENNVTFYAKYTPNTYTVNFDSKGGSRVNPQNVKHGAKADKPSVPTRTGYEFQGWYTSEDATASVYDFDTEVTQNITLYAQWTPNTYTVTFKTETGGKIDGNMSDVTHSVAYDSDFPETPGVTADTHYEFDKWVDENGNKVTTFPKKVTGNATYIAKWKQVSTDPTPVTPVAARYIVEHYKWNAVTKTYALAETEYGPATAIGTTVTATPKQYDDYTLNLAAEGAVQEGTIPKFTKDAPQILTLKLYYDIDKIGDGENKNQPDGIPDRYQVTINYISNDNTMGTVSVGKEVKTIESAGKWQESGTVKISGSTAQPKENYHYVKWTDTDGTDLKSEATLPTKDISMTGGQVYTFTAYFAENSQPDSKKLNYTIIQNFIDGKGNPIEAMKKKTPKTIAAEDAAKVKDLNTMIPEDMQKGFTDSASNKYMYVPTKTTFSTETLRNGTEINLYYYLDNWKDGSSVEEDNDKGGDGIPDCDQVLIKYASSNSERGNVSPDMEVLTIRKGNEKVEATANGSTATTTGSSRNYFSNWTKDNTQVSTHATLNNEAIQKVIQKFKGGETYTFIANFGRSSGGSSRPSTPTVTIPDDVPTGLNGKDHYAYIIGYGNNDVRPQNNITRAEVATIFFRLLTDETREANMTKSNGYNDVKDGDWFCCAVSTLSKMGIIKGYEDGSFKPNDPISRAEFAAIAARFDPDGDKTPASFSDVTSHWAKDEISIAANHGWIKGYEDGSFKPDQKITRAETMTLVNRVLNRLPETKDDLHKDMKTWVDNMDETAWYYLAVQEATNSHYFKNKTGTKFEQWTDLRDTRDWSELEK